MRIDRSVDNLNACFQDDFFEGLAAFKAAQRAAEATHDTWIDDNDVEWLVHRWNQSCTEYGCAIHAPSDHHMKDWPQIMSTGTLVVRVCEHDYDHPDPDSFAYFAAKGQYHMGVHNCDGCCHISPKPRDGETRVIPNCDAWGSCTMPRGHNMGKADIPSNHNLKAN